MTDQSLLIKLPDACARIVEALRPLMPHSTDLELRTKSEAILIDEFRSGTYRATQIVVDHDRWGKHVSYPTFSPSIWFDQRAWMLVAYGQIKDLMVGWEPVRAGGNWLYIHEDDLERILMRFPKPKSARAVDRPHLSEAAIRRWIEEDLRGPGPHNVNSANKRIEAEHHTHSVNRPMFRVAYSEAKMKLGRS